MGEFDEVLSDGAGCGCSLGEAGSSSAGETLASLVEAGPPPASEEPPAGETLASLVEDGKLGEFGRADSEGGQSLASLVEAADAPRPPAAEPEVMVVVGGLEHHVGGWSNYEADRRSMARHGVGGAELFPGRTYVGADDVIESLLPPAGELAAATRRLAASQLHLASNYSSRSGVTLSSIDVQGLADELADEREHPCVGQALLAVEAASTLAMNLSPRPAGLEKMRAAADAACLECASESRSARKAAAEGASCRSPAGLRALEAKCLPAARATELCAARAAAYVDAVAAGLDESAARTAAFLDHMAAPLPKR